MLWRELLVVEGWHSLFLWPGLCVGGLDSLANSLEPFEIKCVCTCEPYAHLEALRS